MYVIGLFEPSFLASNYQSCESRVCVCMWCPLDCPPCPLITFLVMGLRLCIRSISTCSQQWSIQRHLGSTQMQTSPAWSPKHAHSLTHSSHSSLRPPARHPLEQDAAVRTRCVFVSLSTFLPNRTVRYSVVQLVKSTNSITTNNNDRCVLLSGRTTS